jgi:hypothetical protein
MTRSRWGCARAEGNSMRTQRLAAATGAIYVVAVMVGNGIATAGQSNVPSGQQVLHDLQHRTTAQSVGILLEVLSFAALMIFLGYLYRVLRRAERPDGWAAAAALVTGIVPLAIKLGSAAPGLAAFLRRDELSPDLARTLDDIGGAAFVISGYAFGVFVAVAAGAAFATRALPRWLTITGLVVGALTVVAGLAGVLDPAGYVPVPFLLCTAWILVTSIVLTVRRPAGAPERATEPVPAELSATA